MHNLPAFDVASSTSRARPLEPAHAHAPRHARSVFELPFDAAALEEEAKAKLGPRRPWHDMRCRLDGPAEYDVVDNFEQRWRKTKRLRLRGVLPFGKKAHWKDLGLYSLKLF